MDFQDTLSREEDGKPSHSLVRDTGMRVEGTKGLASLVLL